MTGESRLERPTLDEELSWGLHFFNETLVEGTREVGDRLGDAVRRHFPDARVDARAFLRFGSWIGGDRDGNADVSTAVTRRTLRRHHDNAIGRYTAELDGLVRLLSISEHISPPDEAFRERLSACLDATGDAEGVARRNPHEPFRQFCAACAIRLRANLGAADGVAVPYRGPDELADDLSALERALREIGAAGVASGDVASLRRLVACFGFRTASLDIRQNAAVVRRTVAALGGTPATLADELAAGVDVDTEGADLDEEAAECVALFALLGESHPDPEAVGAFILSMSSSAEDVLGVVWLAAAVGATANFPPIVPLFETIDNLREAPDILDGLLADARTRAAVTDEAGVLEIMLGYAETDKDGGYLASVWESHKAQRALSAVGEKRGVPVRFLHGRGGAVSRGGVTTGRAIAAQPRDTVRGRLRVIEHGEVVSAKYSNLDTARTHLELLGAGVLDHTLRGTARGPSPMTAEVAATMEALASESREAYRELLETPGFLDYFLAASPIEEISLLRAGSLAPARLGAAGLEHLRANAWAFAWSQNRHHLTGWYGVGSALEARVSAGELEALRAMFAESKLFRLLIDEVEKTLRQTDMAIAARYAGLVEEEDTRRRVFGKIVAEHELTVRHLLAVTGETVIAERFPSFRRRIDDAAPLIERCNAWQVGLLRGHRADRSQDWARVPLLLSMNGIATGLGWTG